MPSNAENRRQRAAAHYDELARITKALSSPLRLRLVDLLRQGPRSVEVLAEQARAELANVSQHLQQLANARLVEREKVGQRVVYRLSTTSVSILFSAVRSVAEDLLPELDRTRAELDGPDEATRDALLTRIREEKVTLVDVRPREEFEAGHLPGALSLPLPELPRRLEELPRKREVVAYCRGPYCPMALEAVTILRAGGFKATHLDLGPADMAGRRGALRVVSSNPTQKGSASDS